MKAVVCKDKKLSVAELPEPVLEEGQTLVRVLRCGICGSDLHVRQHCDHWGTLVARSGYRQLLSSSQPVVFGHEFCGEILEHGPGTTRKLKAGSRVAVVPMIRRGQDIDLLGLSERSPGAYAERVAVQESLMVPVPNGLKPESAPARRRPSSSIPATSRSAGTTPSATTWASARKRRTVRSSPTRTTTAATAASTVARWWPTG